MVKRWTPCRRRFTFHFQNRMTLSNVNPRPVYTVVSQCIASDGKKNGSSRSDMSVDVAMSTFYL